MIFSRNPDSDMLDIPVRQALPGLRQKALNKRRLECGDSSPLSFSGNLALGTTFVCSADFT